MPDPAPLTMRELRGATPRELEELGAERGIDFPARATSSDMRQVLAGRGGALTTDSVATRGELAGAPAGAGLARSNPLLAAAFRRLDDDEHEDVAAEIGAVVVRHLNVDELAELADDFGVDVEREEGEGDPLKDDYVRDLADAIEEGGDRPPAPEPPADPPTGGPAGEDGEDGLDELKKPALQALAQKRDIAFTSRTTVPELQKALRDKGVRAGG